MPEAIQVEFTSEGMEELRRAFSEVAYLSRTTSESIKEDNDAMARSFRESAIQMSAVASAGFSLLRVADILNVLDESTLATARDLISITSSIASLTQQIPAVISLLSGETAAHLLNAAAKWADAHATAVLWGVATLGVALPIILASIAAISGAMSGGPKLPTFGEGAIVRGPTYALIGEKGPEAVVPLDRFGAGTVVHIYYPSFRSRSDMDYLVDRLKRMGLA